jgi:hypothetical protein
MTIDELQEFVAGLSLPDRDALADEGLRVNTSLRPGGYDSSPAGYVSFASTGGDGTHFSIPAVATGPVVMTVPMSFDNPNVVVGEDLHEFLSLGCVYGYFGLEQLAYDAARAAVAIEKAGEQSKALRRLSERFGLTPWPAVLSRLAELRAQQSVLPKRREDAAPG